MKACILFVLCISLVVVASSVLEYRSPSFMAHLMNGQLKSETMLKFGHTGINFKRCYLGHCCPVDLRCCSNLTCCSKTERVGMLPCFN